MKTTFKSVSFCGAFITLAAVGVNAQTYNWISSSEGNVWQQAKISLQGKPAGTVDLTVEGKEKIVTFKAWGATFNELDWDALGILTRAEQDEILHNVFSPEGDLRISRGRISMGANDYARSWYSCDEVEGDFELRYFNIDRDKQTIIPFIRAAQKYNPDMTFWVSPWCPPSWMKIHGDYPVLSSTDYMIQDPRYLQTYANSFCKFIDAYKEQGIPIDMVIYQNEAYSYTPYPGCAWTAEGTIRFNKEYLAPTLKRLHPEVKLYLGTFNTNRQDHVEKIISDKELQACISGMAFQWEGREVLPHIRRQHPEWDYICSESECGWGSFDWKAGEHTFELMNHYLGNGCKEYTFWNFILADNGESPWGWKQNALIRVDSKTRTFTYTPEYYAVKHYARYIGAGAEVMSYKPEGEDKKPVLVIRTPEQKWIVIAGNFQDKAQSLTVQVGKRYLNATLPPHSMHTFEMR